MTIDRLEGSDGTVYTNVENSRHAMQQAKHRNVGGHQILKAIREGVYEGVDGDGNNSYRLESPGVDLWVHVDPSNNKITTVYYDDEQGAVGGAI
jgi:hypothetical protein